VDTGLAANELQVRTVNITARSAEGLTATAAIKVAQNFLTGYGMFVLAGGGATTCTTGTICVGGESALAFDSTFNGILFAGHQFRIEKIRGPFQFVDPLNTNNLVDAVTVTSDTEGKFTTVIRVASGIPAQVALIKVTDVASGAYTFRSFTINTQVNAATLTLIPESINLVGPDDTVCGFGNSDILVFDGKPPYKIICPDPRTSVASDTSTTDPGRFTVNVGAQPPNNCLAAVPCVIIDANNARAVLTITTAIGSPPPKPTPITVTPATLTLTCGGSGAVTATGGTGTYSVSSSNSRVTAVVSGNTITITRLAPDPAGGPFPTSAIITVTDGASVFSVTATVPAAC
jgi:hypothetical protein